MIKITTASSRVFDNPVIVDSDVKYIVLAEHENSAERIFLLKNHIESITVLTGKRTEEEVEGLHELLDALIH